MIFDSKPRKSFETCLPQNISPSKLPCIRYVGDLVIIYVDILQVNICEPVRMMCQLEQCTLIEQSGIAVLKQIRSERLSVLVRIMLNHICMITSALLIRLISSALV